MHNLSRLTHRSRTCALQVNTQDAADLGVMAGDRIRVSSAQDELEVDVEITADIAPGLVSLPHGWGHAGLGDHRAVASANPGVNVKELLDYWRWIR